MRIASTFTLLALVALVTISISRGTATGAKSLSITRGGTYGGGEYETIAIKTSEPVTIENITLRGSGDMITSHYVHANATIRNVHAIGANPNVKDRAAGRFVSIEGFDNVSIENCTIEGTAGIYLLDYDGNRAAGNTVRIIANRAKNIDGRKSDGAGGYLPEPAELVQFLQLDKIRRVPGVEIAWNEVINEPGKSRVEDVISIYLSSGQPDSPIKIHDNFIRGAYPINPETEEFSGGGIMCGDGKGNRVENAPAYIHAFGNQVLDTVNYGIAISAGHDNQIYRNRIVSTGTLPDGKPIAAQNVGAYIWDSYKSGEARFFNNSGQQNVSGWINKDGRNDWWTPDASSFDNNAHYPGALTREVYDQEWNRWTEKCKSAQVQIGASQ